MKNVLVLMPVEARHKEKIEAAGNGRTDPQCECHFRQSESGNDRRV